MSGDKRNDEERMKSTAGKTIRAERNEGIKRGGGDFPENSIRKLMKTEEVHEWDSRCCTDLGTRLHRFHERRWIP